jgi:hypothetical protein
MIPTPHITQWRRGAVIAALILAFVSPSAIAQEEKKEKLPAAREVIERFIKAMGGREAYSKIHSQSSKGLFEMPAQGIKAGMQVFAKRPDKLVVKIEIPGLGEVTQGFDGKVAWANNAATGPMVLDGKQFEQRKLEAHFDQVLHDEKDYKSMETQAITDFEGRPCHKLKLVRTSGDEVIEYYDVATGMLIGYTATQESPLGAINTTSVLGEYKKFGDVLFATKVTQRMGPLEQVMTITSMELNQVEDSAFELPPAIKAMLKK